MQYDLAVTEELVSMVGYDSDANLVSVVSPSVCRFLARLWARVEEGTIPESVAREASAAVLEATR